ncbi:bile acid beta-glucosidase [Leptolyngbya sp. FACHB-36]|uniref:GH116 family glycosyl hydrolase n=1 Tax=Leptolyngbya sp. FACHB-36 TaxID=2692808 RepID=UPI0016815887|nr:GH116 family glycosyl hydrolase [Leptolyngbya sp. FACHB-36]MBD2022348.1 bile acid beta-glucosidase [Leptolyngbya sp. FACHB-36]
MQQRYPVEIPACAWSRPIGLGWQNPYTVRYASNLDDGPWHGMPLGGFGAGCVGRSPRGDFNLWHIDGGEHVFRSLPACQFSVFEQVGDQAQAYGMCTEAPEDGSLGAWAWYPSGAGAEENATGTYHALFPRSWCVYENVFQAGLTCEQFSPIVANNYQETSYPVAVFQWTAHNPTDRPITLSILLTWQNLVGWFTNALRSPDVQLRDDGSPVYEYQPKWGQSEGNRNCLIGDEQRIGLVLERRSGTEANGSSSDPTEGDGQWSIATFTNPILSEVFYHTRWNPIGDGSDIWESFAADGSLPNVDDEAPAVDGEQVAGAIAVRFTLRPGQTRQIPFVLAWDFPVTEFAAGVEYFRRYTDFFGRTGENAWTIARTALKHYPTWREKIQSWQQPILEQDLPDWFKMALLNELYNLTDGGTLWSAADERDPVGQFAVLECIDYRWYESLDVRLYASFALLMLFPQLEKAVIRAFARSIPASDETLRVIGYYYTLGSESQSAIRKAAGATPHDLGAPNEHVWEKTNYTSYQDCNLWKDLPCDFVLQVYRDYLLTGAKDVEFLAECWDAIVQTLTYLKTFDHDNDGIPENSGAPDQTFDDWKLQGVSAYCGGLWIAALEATIAIAQALGKDEEAFVHHCQDWLRQSRSIYQATLWNGQYYRIDSGSGSNVVMADQLCGQFYARLLQLPDIVPEDCAKTALRSIYDACFVKFNQYLTSGALSGQNFTSVQEARAAEQQPPLASASLPHSLTPTPTPSEKALPTKTLRVSEIPKALHSSLPIGAANGVRPDGTPENPNSTHPLEVWTGINFGLAAFLLQQGMQTEAFEITEAVVRQIYENGLQFRTPEAITANNTFRASHYLRATAIWAIYWVMQNRYAISAANRTWR